MMGRDKKRDRQPMHHSRCVQWWVLPCVLIIHMHCTGVLSLSCNIYHCAVIHITAVWCIALHCNAYDCLVIHITALWNTSLASLHCEIHHWHAHTYVHVCFLVGCGWSELPCHLQCIISQKRRRCRGANYKHRAGKKHQRLKQSNATKVCLPHALVQLLLVVDVPVEFQMW